MVISMEPEILATLLGVAFAALVAASGAGFRWLRSDLRDLRSHVDTRFEERTETTNAQFAAVDARFAAVDVRFDKVDVRFDRLDVRFDRLDVRFDRLEAKVDDLIMALARSGSLIDPQLAAPRPPPLAPESAPAAQPPESAPAPTQAPAEAPLPSGPTAQPA